MIYRIEKHTIRTSNNAAELRKLFAEWRPTSPYKFIDFDGFVEWLIENKHAVEYSNGAIDITDDIIA